MSRLPRLAIGAWGASADCRAMTWGLMDVFARSSGLAVQHFLSRACFAPWDGVGAITGQSSRHLDAWLMPRDVCREVFAHAARSADLAVVEGVYDAARQVDAPSAELDPLCEWLDLPRVAVLDAEAIGNCRTPARPPRIDAVLLDGCIDEVDFRRRQTIAESLWGVPVMGGLPRLPQLRAELAALPRGCEPPRRLTIELGGQFARMSSPERLHGLAMRRDFAVPPPRLFRPDAESTRPTVAVAFDAAFRCYFPDTLDLLEVSGAQVVGFSPLKDEELPPETDIVYMGCGHPERFAAELAANHCMALALRHHVCSGRRLYAEGGGLAYLCEQIEMPDGSPAPMSGVLPMAARLVEQPSPPTPTEVALSAATWLGEPGTTLRGYRNGSWEFSPRPGAHPCAADAEGRSDLFGKHHAVGSRLHLNFAVQPDVFQGFLRPHSACLELARARAGVPRSVVS